LLIFKNRREYLLRYKGTRNERLKKVVETKTTERENKRKVISKWERITKKVNSFTIESLRLKREGIA
jgi:hypothetical protein